MSDGATTERLQLLQGTLDLLVLQTLQPGPLHGHAIAKALERRSDDVLQVEQGSLYPALHRLLKRGWIGFDHGTSENNRRAKYYRLTAKGRTQLDVETSKWDTRSRALARVLRPAGCAAAAASTTSTRTSAITSSAKPPTTSTAACRRARRAT